MKQLESQLNEVKGQLGEVHRGLTESQAARARLQADNGELIKRFEETDAQLQQAGKAKSAALKQIEELKVTRFW